MRRRLIDSFAGQTSTEVSFTVFYGHSLSGIMEYNVPLRFKHTFTEYIKDIKLKC